MTHNCDKLKSHVPSLTEGRRQNEEEGVGCFLFAFFFENGVRISMENATKLEGKTVVLLKLEIQL